MLKPLAAALGRIHKALHTNALDEAISTCQQIFLQKLHVILRLYIAKRNRISRKAIDPWAGSYYVEYLTKEFARKRAWELN